MKNCNCEIGYTKRKVSNLLKKLHRIMEDKSSLDIHNEVGYGRNGFTEKEEKELENFDIHLFIRKNLK